jgi:hypothetical protein
MAYPSAMPSSLDVTKRYIINNDNLLKWLHIKIKTLTASNSDNFNSNGLHAVSHGKSSIEYQPQPAHISGYQSGSSSNISTSPEMSDTSSGSGSDEDDTNAVATNLLKDIISKTANTIADGLEISGQLKKGDRYLVLYKLFKRMTDEIALEGEKHSPPGSFPSPPPGQSFNKLTEVS